MRYPHVLILIRQGCWQVVMNQGILKELWMPRAGPTQTLHMSIDKNYREILR